MKRNGEFTTRPPFSDHDSLQSLPANSTGPIAQLNPTRAQFDYKPSHAESIPSQHRILLNWSSRDNRKGRHALTITKSAEQDPSIETPKASTTPRQIGRGILRMVTVFPVWDVSYLVATIFTLGSVVWVFNAFFVFLPLLKPSTTFGGEVLYGGGITAFIGASIFEIGSVLLMLEAINENQEGCFGWALEEALDRGESGEARFSLRPSQCKHHHPNKRNLVGHAVASPADSGASSSSVDSPAKTPDASTLDANKSTSKRSWRWYPTWQALRTHYFHELGFLACLFQFCGATIFWIAGFTALPGIFNHLSQGLIDGVYWTPQVVGGSGFIISGTLFMVETQERWWKPAFGVLGWHIGLWNLIGGIGFTLSPAFGYDTASWAQYQASCSTFWGSWAFLIGSAIQWYESLDKYPIKVTKG